MKIIALTCMCIFISVSSCFATALTETGDNRAKPVVLYGTTSDGLLKPILTDSDGKAQLG